MNRSDLRTLVIAIAVGLLACTVPVAAQETGVPPGNGGVTQEPTATALPTVKELEQRLAALSEAGGLAEDVVATIREQYTQAIRFLGEAEAETKRAADLRALADSAPQRFEAARAELATPAVDSVVPPPAEAKLSDLQQSLRTAQAESDQARSAVPALEAETQQRSTRRVEIPQQIAAARQRLDELRAAPDATVPNGPAELTSARRISRRAEQAAAAARIDALTAELASYDTRAELLTARRDLAARRLTTAERTVAAWQALVTQRQEQELNRQREESEKARREAARSHPQLAAIGRENEAIVAERAALSEKRKALDAAKTRVTDQRSRLDTKLTEVKTKAEATASPTESLALLLRRMRDELPNPRRLQADMAQLTGEIERTQFRLIELDQQRAGLADPAAAAERRFAQLDPPVPPAQADQARQALAELLRTQRDYLTDLHTDCDRYFNTLVEVSSATQALFETVDEFADYINERVLWIRSAEPLGPKALPPVAEAIGWLTDPAHWAALAKQVRADLAAHPVVNSLCLLLLVAVVIASWRARTWLKRIADQVSTDDDRFALTPAALLPTILLALPAPAVLGLVAWRLWAASFGDGLGGALAMGLRSAAAVVLTFQFVRQVVRPRGLGELHFRWRTARLEPLRQYLPWLSAIVAPLMFIVMAMEHSSSHEYTTSLGRIAHILANVVASFGFLIIVRGSARGAGETPSRSPEDRMRLMNLLRYPLLVALPLALAGISAAGYHYSALQLNVRLVATIWLLIVVVLINAVVRRWLYLQRRTLVLEQRRRRREEAEAARAAAAETAGAEATADEVPAIETESTELDAYTINVQTRKFLATALTVVSVLGLWVIWAEVLPALGYLDRLSLWADGETIVSVADLALAIIVGALTVVAARNIPGLLEVVALQRLPFEPGVRFAITTVVRYTVTVVGLILTFGAIGIGWSKVQWLAAAVTVGLGFGLQEIFANFVSGLIILFEQPVRVGDIVTVGDTTGVVTRIRIRATTITDWDRKEYIVPNKEFVTGRMLNWSLSDKITRVTVNVGVAYGSDTDRARGILSQVARDNPSVLDDPAPLITFEGFGDSTLNLVLRAYLPNMDNRLTVISELHTAIDKAFRNAGIEIAFPQRDLHIRSVQATMVLTGLLSLLCIASARAQDDSIHPAANSVEQTLHESMRPLHRPLMDDIDRPLYETIQQVKAAVDEATRLRLSAEYTLIYQASLDGHAHDDAAVGTFNLNAKWTAWKHENGDIGGVGMQWRHRALYTDGGTPAFVEDLGTLWATNSFNSSSQDEIRELWWAQRLADGRLAYALGKIDSTDYLNTNRFADSGSKQFFAQPFISNPARSFPSPGLGAAAEVRPVDGLYLRSVVADGTSVSSHSPFDSIDDGRWFYGAEIGIEPGWPGLGRGVYRLTYWYRQNVDDQGDGIALSWDQNLGPGLGVFLRYGYAADRIRSVEQVASTGITLLHPFGRRDDLAGIGIGWSRPSDTSLDDEGLIEGFYRIQLTHGVEMTPDIQIILNPPEQDDELICVLGVRLRLLY